MRPSNFLAFSIPVVASAQEGTRAAGRRFVPKNGQTGNFGSRPSVCQDQRRRQATVIADVGKREKRRTPPGILTPAITAPDGGTIRGRPTGTVGAIRSISLMTAVCS